MRTRSFCSEILLVALVALSGWRCTVKSSSDPGTAGSGGGSGSAGTAGSGGTTGDAGSGGGIACPEPTPSTEATGPGGSTGSTMGPCDIYAADGGPCVAAHSTVRALFGAYNGPLYQVRKTDCTPKDIFVATPGGMANAGDQDTFCGSDACTISIIYDQSGHGNHLTHGPPGMAKNTADKEANAKAIPIMLGGQRYYGVHIVPGIGYRNNQATGTATGDAAETEYMVAAGDFFNASCCFDYGNMERNSHDNGEGTMEAVYFGNCTVWNKGAANGPWVMGDLENGLWAGDSSPYDNNMPVTWKYVTGMVKGDSAGKNHWTIKEGDATSGNLITPFNGQRPSTRYNPMRKEGAIGLGTGGDNSNGDRGNWFEGVMTAAYSSDSADNAVQANIVSIYGQP